VRRAFLIGGGLISVAAVAGALVIAGAENNQSHTAAPAAPTAPAISVSVGTCGAGWTDPVAGAESFTIHNTDYRPGDITLVNPSSGAIFAFIDNLGPNTTSTMPVTLGGGTYAFRCAFEDESVVTGPSVSVPGAPMANTAVPPVTQNDLIGPTKAYEAYVSSNLPGLTKLVDRLSADIKAGNLTAARTDWLPAHLEYERLGAAYGAFGDADGEINGTTAGRPKGVDDPDFTGFHRLEYGLWHGQSAAELAPVAAKLQSSVAGLVKEFANAQIDPLDVSIRAHEITENALQFELTGETNYGSNSNLATIQANLDGTKELLMLLQPILTPRYSALPQVNALLAKSEADLNAQQHDGKWTPLDQLDETDRERLNSDISELSQQLAPIASICEPRRTS
jgi:iron uptake system component EfeO